MREIAVNENTGNTGFAVSNTGVLAIRSTSEIGRLGEPGPYGGVELSHTRVRSGYGVQSGSPELRETVARWSSDDDRTAFNSNRSGPLRLYYMKRTDGTGPEDELLDPQDRWSSRTTAGASHDGAPMERSSSTSSLQKTPWGRARHRALDGLSR